MAKVELELTKTDNTKHIINKFNGLKSIESTSQSTVSTSSINFGVLANTGTAEVVDANGTIKEMIENGELSDTNVPITLYINGNQIQSHISQDSDYLLKEKIFTIPLSNDIINYSKLNVSYSLNNIRTQSTLYVILWSCLESLGWVIGQDYDLTNTLFFETYIDQYGDEDIRAVNVETYLSRFQIKHPYFLDSNLQSIINVICTTAHLIACKDKDNRLIFVNAVPRMNTSTSLYAPNIIHIPKHLQVTNPDFSLFTKNTIKNVAFQKRNIQNNISDVVLNTYQILDDNNNLILSQLGDYSQFLTEGSTNYVCFFIRVNTDSNNLVLFDINRNSDGVSPYVFEFIDSSGEVYGSGGSTVVITTDTMSSISTFNFSSTSGAFLKELVNYRSATTATFACKVATDGTRCKYIRVTIRGRSYKVALRELQTANLNEDYYTLPNCEFLADNNNYTDGDGSNTNIYEYLANNIITYYQNGIRTTKLTIFLSDFYSYNTRGSAIKRVDYTNNGEIIEIDQNLIIDKDNNLNSAFKDSNNNDIIWRVVGKTFRYNGSPLLDLELQEVRE